MTETLERAPIVLNCMSRGGSNIFWNLFLTHPDACSPILETLTIFRADLRGPSLPGVLLALLSGQPGFFDQWKLRPRPPYPRWAARRVDRVLRDRKLRTLTDEDMRYKRPGELYTQEEVEAARLVLKNNNGLVFLTDFFRELYPDATFFGLVRHPLALWESHKRRRIFPSPAAFTDYYLAVTGKMLADAERLEHAHLARFEDVLADPLGMLRRLHRQAGLDPGRVSAIRFKSKEHYLADGSRGAAWETGRHRWLAPGDVAGFLQGDINRLQASHLDAAEQRAVLEATAPVLERLGYGPSP